MSITEAQGWETDIVIQLGTTDLGNGHGQGNGYGIGNGQGGGLDNNPNIPEVSTFALVLGVFVFALAMFRRHKRRWE